MASMLTDTLSLEIPYIRLRFCAEIPEDTIMPSSKVSALRGGMGEMLIRQNCVRDRRCEACMFNRSCIVMHTLYSYMETKPSYMQDRASVGYLIECDDYAENYSAGSCLRFDLILFGESIVYFNIYLQALHNLGLSGLGKHHSRFRILEVSGEEGERILTGNTVDMEKYRIRTVSEYVRRRKEQLAGSSRYRISFTSPLSLKYDRRYLQRFSIEAVMHGILRRVQMLDYYIGCESIFPDLAEYPRLVSQQARPEQISRYSGTHQSQMSLQGIVGEMVIDRVPENCLTYLVAGELIHLGKNTSFGFGKYSITPE